MPTIPAETKSRMSLDAFFAMGYFSEMLARFSSEKVEGVRPEHTTYTIEDLREVFEIVYNHFADPLQNDETLSARLAEFCGDPVWKGGE